LNIGIGTFSVYGKLAEIGIQDIKVGKLDINI